MQARAEDLGHTAFLERLLAIEVAATTARRLLSLERFAALPAPWRLADFDFDAQPSVDRKLVDELGTLRFLEDATNVLFIGPPGVGKTMLAVGLGRAAVEAGYRTYYTTAAELAARCHRAAIEGRWATTMRFYAGPRLLIIDEVGYLPLAAEAAAALFQVITQRYLKGSVILPADAVVRMGRAERGGLPAPDDRDADDARGASRPEQARRLRPEPPGHGDHGRERRACYPSPARGSGPAPGRARAGQGQDRGPGVHRVDATRSPLLPGRCVGMAPPDGRGALTASPEERLVAYL